MRQPGNAGSASARPWPGIDARRPKWANHLRLGLALALLAATAAAQPPWQRLAIPTHASLRGLSLTRGAVWTSGSGGTIVRTRDGGAHWQALPVPGAERLDFRDVKAFGTRTAYAMAIGAQGGIFKTSDGGAHWIRQYAGADPGFFLDALAFWDADHGLALGDPLQGHFLLLRTTDGGHHWRRVQALPPALPGEGAFAASGSALVALPGSPDAWFATGGASSARVFHSRDSGRTWSAVAVPMAAGSAGAGIFSLAFWNPRQGVAVGGDYTRPMLAAGGAAVTGDGGARWRPAAAPGYRSSVAAVPGSRGARLVAVGPTGADVSRDGGAHWTPLLPVPLNAVALTPDGSGWAVGPGGTIVRFRLP